MRKWNIGLVGSAVALLLVCIPLNVGANPDQYILVTPLELDFEEVDVGMSESLQVTIKNNNGHFLFIEDVYLDPNGSQDYTVDANVPIILGSGDEVIATVTFSPTSDDEHRALLVVLSNDPEADRIEVPIIGIGIGSLTIESILAFFDDSVEEGNIQGTGPTCAAKRAHLKVFKFKLLMAAFFIAKGWDKGACTLLGQAYDRSDGQKPPKDWIEDVEEGSGAVLELNNMLLQLMSDMGCV
ncbi:hypothetical protein ACFL2F_01825 [Myxococcota bacterium]